MTATHVVLPAFDMVERFFKGSGFLPVSLHPSSAARQKQNKRTCYLNEMDRYGPASLNSLISVFCRLRWLKADTMLILCLKMSFSFSLRAVYCLTGTVLYSCISIFLFFIKRQTKWFRSYFFALLPLFILVKDKILTDKYIKIYLFNRT